MRASIVAFGLATGAIASYAPPAYGQDTVPTYPVETATEHIPSYETATEQVSTYETATEHVPSYETVTEHTSTYETATEHTSTYETATEHVSSHETASVPVYSDMTVSTYETIYTTYCPEPTTVTHEGKTYTIKTATTLTIPATYTTEVPVHSVPAYIPTASADQSSVPAYQPSAPAPTPYSPEMPTTPVVTLPVQTLSTATVPYYPVHQNTTSAYGTGSPSATQSKPAAYTGAAVANVAGGAMAGLVAIAAFFM